MSPWHNVRLLETLGNGLAALAFVLLVGAALAWYALRPGFDLREIVVDAAPGHELRNLPQQRLARIVGDEVRGNFFTVDLHAVRRVIESVPWVRRADVRRVWPNRLAVDIEEHRALALWEDGRLVNTFGELFAAGLDDAEANGPLPVLAGPPGTEAEVAARFGSLRDAGERLGLYPVSVSLSARHAWRAQFDDGTVLLLGRERDSAPIEQRVARWARSYPEVVTRLNRRAEVIDLRYPNGFAIRSLAQFAEPGALETR